MADSMPDVDDTVEACEALELDSDQTSVNGNIDDVEIAQRGMTLLLNNEWDEAQDLFSKYQCVFTSIFFTHNVLVLNI